MNATCTFHIPRGGNYAYSPLAGVTGPSTCLSPHLPLKDAHPYVQDDEAEKRLQTQPHARAYIHGKKRDATMRIFFVVSRKKELLLMTKSPKA
ncbi:hypothetical protein TNCV_3665871 [Trichonephila clavipes]|nr:hypothetical protein TNCV_3665871 [Trichonephila clavipes]